MKKLECIGQSERSLFINRLSQFIMDGTGIENFINSMVENWHSVTIEASTKTSLPIQAEEFKNCKTFLMFYSKILKNLQVNKDYKRKSFDKNSFDYDSPLTGKFLKTIYNGIVKNKISSKGSIGGGKAFSGAGARYINGLNGLKHQIRDPKLTKENLSSSLYDFKKDFKKINNLVMRFKFNLFYIDGFLSLNNENFQYGSIKIPVYFELSEDKKNEYLEFKVDDLKKIIVESIKKSLTEKFDELMSREFSTTDFLGNRCNSLFITDGSILEFFNDQRGKTLRKLINSVSGDERERLLNLLKKFLNTDFD